MASRKAQREAARQERLRREAEEAAAQRRRRMTQLGFIGVVAAAAIVGIAIAVSQSGGGSSGGSASDVTAKALVRRQLAGIPQHGTILGNPKARVTIVEFGDPQCPACKEFSELVAPKLIAGPVRSGEARYEFRPWLIIGPDSKPAAEAALAAGEQGRFWNYITLWYRNQGEENSGYVTDDFMTAIAKGAGVPDLSKWDSDRQSARWNSAFTTIEREASDLGFNSTPSVYVQGPKGRKVLGSFPTTGQVEAAIKAVG